jgi:hypothetical protein
VRVALKEKADKRGRPKACDCATECRCKASPLAQATPVQIGGRFVDVRCGGGFSAYALGKPARFVERIIAEALRVDFDAVEPGV